METYRETSVMEKVVIAGNDQPQIDKGHVEHWFQQMALTQQENSRIDAAKEFANASRESIDPRKPRGSEVQAATGRIAPEQLTKLYDLFSKERGELQYQLGVIISHVADEQFVPIAEALLQGEVDNDVYGCIISALTNIAGPEALRLLEAHIADPIDSRRRWVQSAIGFIKLGGIADYAEGLDEVRDFPRAQKESSLA
jgi:hypothetical protein